MLKFKKKLELAATSNKLFQDIIFLVERLELIQEQSSPNIQVLETYQNMLDYRLDVLAEILTQCPKVDDLQAAPFHLKSA